MRLTRNDWIWAAAIGVVWVLAGADLLSPRMPPDNVAILWMPNAVLAAAMLRRIRQPPTLAFFVAMAAVGSIINSIARAEPGGGTFGWILLTGANCVEAYLIAVVANQFGGPAFSFHRSRNVVIWMAAVLAAATVSMLLAWAVSSTGLVTISFTHATAAASHWILGNACAHLTLGALLVSLTGANAQSQIAALRADPSRTALMALAVLITAVIAFAGPRLWEGGPNEAHPGYLALLLPALMWAAFSYGPIAAATASLMALAAGVALSVNGWGPFAQEQTEPARDLQVMILALAGATLLIGVLGASVREARDKAAAADRVKTLFLSRVGHELRTPLNGVIGAADLLARDMEDAPASQQDRLDLVRSSARTLAAVVEDLVEFAAMHREGVSIRPAPFEASRPFEDASAIFEPQAKWNNVALRLTLSGFDNLWIVSDPARLRQVLFALVANAVEATSRGQIIIEATATDRQDNRVLLHAVVRDTGGGVAPALVDRIFEPFSQGLGGDLEDGRRPSPGLGLGLAVAKETIGALGGAIRLENMPGEGAAFHIELIAERAVAPVSGVDARVRARALLAEDNPTNRIVLTAMLSALGFDVVAVETGAEALAAAEKRDFTLVVMDIQMPVMDGEEAIERIRALEGPRSQTPIIVVTAHALAGDDRRYAAAGANSVLSKPVALQELAAAVADVVS